MKSLFEYLEDNPIISAVKDKYFEDALSSPSNVIFLLGTSILKIEDRIQKAHKANKLLFLHIDLADE